MFVQILARILFYIGLLTFLLSLNDVQCYSRGAPPSADICRDLTPRHNIGPQTDESRFWLQAVKIPNINVVNVTLYAPPRFPFKGFMIQARDDQDSIVNGEFTSTEGIKAISCLNTRPNTLTHSNNRLKYSVNSIWRPHSSAVRIHFKCTVVVEKLRYYLDIYSQTIDLSPTTAITATLPPETSTATSASTENGRPAAQINFPETAYEGCDNKTCIGITNCVPTKNCDILLTGQLVNEDEVQFELYGNIKNAVGDRWFSMGVSHNTDMSDASVTDCIALTSQGNVIMQDSWNDGYSNHIQTPTVIKPVITSIQDGHVKCVWRRPMVTNVNGQTFNLSNSYILLAYGASNGNQKEQHDDKIATSSSIDFRKSGVAGVSGINPSLIKAHGSLMVIAWLGIVSIGIMLARHYKSVWADRKLLGQKVWFTCHRALMLTAGICAIASMICIFIFYGWKINSTHAYFGVAANAFMILQPIGAMFRCHPGTDNRWVFNWFHWFGGNAGQICALIAIFLATYLKATGLSMVFLWLVVAFLAMHITVHLIMQIHARFLVNENRVNDNIAMQDIHANKSEMFEDTGEYFKQLMLGVYVVLVTVVVFAMVLMIAFAKTR